MAAQTHFSLPWEHVEGHGRRYFETTVSYTQILKLKFFKNWSWEILCLVVYLMLTGSQLFVPPIIGLADNGDFPKVLGPRSVCDPDHEQDTFAYVIPRYVIRSTCRWDSRLPSSESLFVRVLKLSAKWAGRDSFKVTGVGKLHLVFVAAALGIVLWALHEASPVLRFGVPPLVILIFSDVAYIAYLNSFYMDATTLVFLLPTVALAAAWLMRPQIWVAIAFGIVGIFLGLSKTQHVITYFLLAGLAVWFAVRALQQGSSNAGRCWLASAVAVVLATVRLLAITPYDYKAEPLYSAIFFRILPASPNQLESLMDLGLPASDLQYSGTHAYFDGAPVMKRAWRDEFVQQITYANLAAFYMTNPKILFGLIAKSLKDEVHEIRPGNIANYEKESGFPPNTLADRFGWWSSLRSRLLDRFPTQVVLLYALMGIGALLCVFRRTWAERWPLYPLVITLVGCGTVEFLFPILLDGTETSRHLFLFHVITELVILCAFGAMLRVLPFGKSDSLLLDTPEEHPQVSRQTQMKSVK
jgi:hypothetical protein